jgi:hypothetical protein
LLGLVCTGCSHELEVKNLDVYAAPVRLASGDEKFTIAVLPYSGRPDAMFYFNALVERVHNSPAVSELRTDYLPGKGGRFEPVLILSINPEVRYRSSGWNFLINWPGFLIFTPAWNGYVYHADILTQVAIHDGTGKMLSEDEIAISYNIRQAEMDRTIFTGLTWLEVSLLAFGGGIYNAANFDEDIVGSLQVHVKDNYVNYVANQVGPKLIAAADAARPVPAPVDAVPADPVPTPPPAPTP